MGRANDNMIIGKQKKPSDMPKGKNTKPTCSGGKMMKSSGTPKQFTVGQKRYCRYLDSIASVDISYVARHGVSVQDTKKNLTLRINDGPQPRPTKLRPYFPRAVRTLLNPYIPKHLRERQRPSNDKSSIGS